MDVVLFVRDICNMYQIKEYNSFYFFLRISCGHDLNMYQRDDCFFACDILISFKTVYYESTCMPSMHAEMAHLPRTTSTVTVGIVLCKPWPYAGNCLSWRSVTKALFYQHGLTLIPVRINKYIERVSDEITYPLLNRMDEYFISHFIRHLITYPWS